MNFSNKLKFYLKLTFIVIFCVFSFFKLKSHDLLKHLYFKNIGYRIPVIEEVDNVYQKYHIPLLFTEKIKNEIIFKKVENIGDDIGIYYYLPFVKKTFGIETINSTYLFFFIGITILSFLISVIGLMYLMKSKKTFYLASLFVFLFHFTLLYILDVYVINVFVISFIPLFIYLFKYRKHTVYFFIFLFILGCLIGFSNNFRAQSGLALLLFIITYFILNRKDIGVKKILISLLIVLSGMLLEKTHFNFLKKGRDNFLEIHPNNYQIKTNDQHIFWHPLYLGLGFLDNQYGIKWKDNFGYNAVNKVNKKINVSFTSCGVEYEKEVKKMYISLFFQDPLFIIKSYFYKFIYCLFILILAVNFLFIKIKSSIFSIKNIPFIIVLLYTVLPGVIVWPIPMYILSFVFLFLIWIFLEIDESFNLEAISRKKDD